MQTDSEVIYTVTQIIDEIKKNGAPVKLSIVSTLFLKFGIKKPIWKKYKMTLSDFIKKFPEIIHYNDSTQMITLISDYVTDEQIIENWNRSENELTKYNKKYNANLDIFQLPDDLTYLVTNNAETCNQWISQRSLRSIGQSPQVIGFDIETTIAPKNTISFGKPSIMQLSTSNDHLIIQLSSMSELPSGIIDCLNDVDIYKVGIGIKNDCKSLGTHFPNFKNAAGIVDLSDIVKFMALAQSQDSYGLRDLAAIFLNVFMTDKGDSDIKKTNWDADVLTTEQINYALTDSYIAVLIYNQLKERTNDIKLIECLKSVAQNLKFHSCDPLKHQENITKKFNDKRENKQKMRNQEDANIKKQINNRIKKWLKSEESRSDSSEDETPQLEFEPMNSYYRNYIHASIQKYPSIQSFSEGSDHDFSRRVILKKQVQKIDTSSLDH